MPTDRLEFRLLGAVEATVGGRLLDLGRRQERCLLGLLLLEPNRPVPADRLLELLWGSPGPTARGTLRTYVARLRSRIGGDGVQLRRSGPGYVIDVDPVAVDLHRFRNEVARASRLDSAGQRAEALREALALWRGPLLAGVADEALRQRIAPVQEEFRLRAVEQWAEAELACARHDLVLAELRQLVADDPFRERAVELLMLALYRGGQPAEALTLFRSTRDRLASDLGIEPGPELQRLHRRMLDSDSTLVGPAGTRTDLVPRLLPQRIPDFVGRTAELARLDTFAINDGPVLISAIAGTGGVGKTALAVHWAYRVEDRYPDGQLYVNLRGHDLRQPLSPVAALNQLLLAMGVPAERIPVDEEGAAGLYRSLLALRRVLVLLDNASSAQQVRPLLPGGRGCLVLVTSRVALSGLVAREGARLLQLDVLSAAESCELIGQLIGAERSAREPQAVQRLAQLCGHLPLALRVAAAMAAARPTARLAEQVAAIEARPLSELRIADDPQSDLRHVFGPSYQALPEADRRLFRLLGLVPGPDFDPGTAAAMADLDIEWARAGLDRLAGANLVAHREPDRFGLHDLLRAYATELAHAEEPDPQAARDRLLAYYLGHVAAAAQLLYPNMRRLEGGVTPRAEFADGPAALAWLDAEQRGLVDAILYAAANGRAEVAWQLADGLRGYLALRSRFADWLAVAEAALAAATAVGDQRAAAAAQMSLGTLHQATGDHTAAEARYQQALRLAQASGWRGAEQAAENNLCTVLTDLGRLDEAAVHSRRSRALERRLAGQVSATAWLNAGLVRLHMGRLRHATDRLVAAVAMSRTGSGDVLAIALHMLGYARHLRGQLDPALEALNEARARFDDAGNTGRAAFADASSALVHLDAGRLDLAHSLAVQARTTLGTLGRRFYESYAAITLAAVEASQGDPTAAQAHVTEGLALARQVGSNHAEVTALLGLAELYHGTGHLNAAAEQASLALVLARRFGYQVQAGQALCILADIHMSNMNISRATECAHEALASHRSTGHRPGVAKAQAILARVD
jgi:DNA-binding SARP family transcriptional activator/Tfp pilus assembly protein PilF